MTLPKIVPENCSVCVQGGRSAGNWGGQKVSTMCKIAYFAGQMGGYNLNKVNGFLASKD